MTPKMMPVFAFLCMMLIGVSTAQAQEILNGTILTEDIASVVQEGTNTIVYTDTVFFSINVEMNRTHPDSLFNFTDATVETQSNGVIPLARWTSGTPMFPTMQQVACPEGLVATYASDDEGRFSLGFCQADERAGRTQWLWQWSSFTDGGVEMPFVVAMAVPEKR